MLAEATMLTYSDWPLYAGSATLHFSTASTKWPGSATGETTPEETGEQVAGGAGSNATAVDGGPGGGGYSTSEAASLASLLSGITDSAAAAGRDCEGDTVAAGVFAIVQASATPAAVGFASRGGGGGGVGGGAATVLDLLGGGGGGGGGGDADGAALI